MKMRHMLLLAISAGGITSSTLGQVQSAGSLLVNVDATAATPGVLNNIANSGALSGYFEARGGGTTIPLATNLAGVNAIVFDGSDYYQLVDSVGGSLVPPPEGVVGPNSTASIEVWAYNPAVGSDETMVSWGKRGTAGANRAFCYGYAAQFGAVSHHGNGATDLGWDNIGGAPQNHRWHHLVYTHDGSTTRVYSDGILINSETQTINTATNAGIMLGAQWNNTGAAVGGQYGSLALARVRVHDGVLSGEQVLNNFNFEKSLFVPASPAPQLLTSGPAHRYSFSETAVADATGLTFNDSVGTAHGTVMGMSGTAPVAKFSGSRLLLPGGSALNFGAYADLPNGLLSVNSTNKGGNGEFTMEVWFKVTNTRAWSHVFDFGSCGVLGNSGIELIEPGGNGGMTMLDDFMYNAQAGSDVNRRRLEWANRDPEPSGSATNATQTVDVYNLGKFGTDIHLVVTWKEETGQIFAYENGVQVASLTVSNAMSALNDVNNWLGRSQYGDNTMEGEIDEVRMYSRVLSPGEALGNFQAGPNVVNTAAALSISANPQGATVLEGNPVSFSVSAGGTPPLYYQWLRNGTAISGANDRTYSITATSSAQNGDIYSVIVSNLSTSVTSGNATLTVQANQAPPTQFLYEFRDGNRDNYSGVAGGVIQIGAKDTPVTHLGYYDLGADGLLSSHRVGIWPSTGGDTPIAFVTVPDGTTALLTNGYRLMALSTPVLLKANTSYILGAEVTASSGDGWPDNYQPLHWNPFFVGAHGFDTRQSRYGGVWPNAPMSGNQVNGIYGAPMLATMPMGPALAGIQQTTVTQYSTMTVTIGSAIGGQAPVSVQWYKAPNTLLPGQTNAALVLQNVQASDAGEYYVKASNGLGSSQSSAVTLVVLNDTPVAFTKQPANQSVYEGYPASFTVEASGTPPVTFQWRRNGNAIPNATNATYTLDPVLLSNSGDVYSCVASNYANGAAQLATSAGATLTVNVNKAPAPQFLHETWAGNRDNYSGMIGGIFMVGANDALVTHLGFFDINNDGLVLDHRVGLWPAAGGDIPIASVTVPAGTGAYLTNGYRYVALEQPLILKAGTSYILAAESFAASGDGWPDSIATTVWDSYYVGSTPANTRDVRYSGFGWPTAPAYGSTFSWGANMIYGAPSLAVLPVGSPMAWVNPNSVTQYVGFSTTLTGVVNGETPLQVQWFKSPSTALPGQTNATLVFNSLTLADAGDYYLQARNPISGATGQSAPVTISVLPTGKPTVTLSPASQSVYEHATVLFSGEATGTPPLRYNWTFNGTPIAGATNATLVLNDVQKSWAGSYQLEVSNDYGTEKSATAVLSVIAVPWGSYAASIMHPDLALYYRLNDAGSGLGIATNQGSAGFAFNGAYQAGFSSVAGPAGFANFEANNTAVLLDGLTADVRLPSPEGLLSGATMAAWVYRPTGQVRDAGIFFHRSTDTFGLSVIPDTVTGADMLRYTWKGTHYAFETGLAVPTNQWALVAASITSDYAIIYIYDGVELRSATNIAAHGACELAGDSYIGWDSAGGALDRRWNGGVDEVMLFSRALSPVEIKALCLGVPGSATLQMVKNGNNLTLTWPGGVLLEAANANGPWTPVAGAVSPYNAVIGAGPKFYRVQLQQ